MVYNSMKRTFVLLVSHHPSRQRAVEAVQNAPDGYVVTVGEATRNLEQNAAQWPLLHRYIYTTAMAGEWRYASWLS